MSLTNKEKTIIKEKIRKTYKYFTCIQLIEDCFKEDVLERYYNCVENLKPIIENGYVILEEKRDIFCKSVNNVFNSYSELNDLKNYIIDCYEKEIIKKIDNDLRFVEDSSFEIYDGKDNIDLITIKNRKNQKLSKLLYKVINEEYGMALINISEIYNTLVKSVQTCYVRLGIDPEDFFKMGAWGTYYTKGYWNFNNSNSSCTILIPNDVMEIRDNIRHTDYKYAILTYMFGNCFVATLYANKDDAENRDMNECMARQIYYYNKEDNNLLGMRGYGQDSNDLRIIRESIANYMTIKNNNIINYHDNLLQNRKNKNQNLLLNPNFYSQIKSFIGNDKDLYFHGYIDTFNYHKYSGHTLIDIPFKTTQQMSLFEEEYSEVLANEEAKIFKTKLKRCINNLYNDLYYEDYDKLFFLKYNVDPILFEKNMVILDKSLYELDSLKELIKNNVIFRNPDNTIMELLFNSSYEHDNLKDINIFFYNMINMSMKDFVIDNLHLNNEEELINIRKEIIENNLKEKEEGKQNENSI
jgi:hypothetical protein